MQAAIDLLRREIRALATILSDNRGEINSAKREDRIVMFRDTAAIHQELDEIQEALTYLVEAESRK